MDLIIKKKKDLEHNTNHMFKFWLRNTNEK